MRSLFLFFALASTCLIAFKAPAQTGNVAIRFTPGGGKPVSISFSKLLFKYDNPHGYWFTNPHTGDRHINLQPDAGYGYSDAAFIALDRQENDMDLFYDIYHDTSHVTFKNKLYVVDLPVATADNAVNPLHIHFNTFTASEISFTISGTMRYHLISDETENWKNTSVTGTGHFYRQPQYIRSDVLPGCNCDPTIYASFYDEENYLRTTSACENSLSNKVFDAMQKTFAPLFSNLSFKGQGGMQPGDISVTILPGHSDISAPPNERPYCTTDYHHNRITTLHAEQKIFTSDDSYGLRFIKMPNEKQLQPDAGAMTPQDMAHAIDSILKLAMAKTITPEEAQNRMKALSQSSGANQTEKDLKKAEMESNLYINVDINPAIPDHLAVKVINKNETVVEHNIPGGAFEIFAPQNLDADENWTANKLNIYFGKFTKPATGQSLLGFDALLTRPVYPKPANKLTVYSIVLELSGGKDLIDKAIKNIDFTSLVALITKE